MSKLKCLFTGMLGAVLVLGAAAALIPAYGDYAGRAALDETLWRLETYREKVARTASRHGSVESSGVGVLISADDYRSLNVDYARVFPDGTLVIRHANYHQVVVLEPSMAAGQVSWKCFGGPRDSVPPSCR